MDHEWGGWPEDESHLDDSLGGDADTADLNDSDGGVSGFGDALGGDHGYEGDHGLAGDHDYSGAELDQPDDDPGAGAGHEPLPDDTFGDQPDDQPFTLGDEPASDDGGPHEEAFGAIDGADATEPTDQGDTTDVGDTADHLVGTDPDVDSGADDPGWHDTAFPPVLDFEHVPEPVDGYPWSDPDVLGDEVSDPAGQLTGGYGSPPVTDLFEYAGLEAPTGGDPWAQLLGSEDPATGALARWWAPGA